MKIILYSQKTVREVKREFNIVYPFLKLEFFRKKHKAGEGSPIWEKVKPSAELIEVSGALKEGLITIHPTDKVKEVEKKFQARYGLPVQVFRKQKNVWMETITTDDLTLQQQNQMGSEASQIIKSTPEDRFIDCE